MTDYTGLVKALRHCSYEGIVKCNECKYSGKEWPFGCEEELMKDAAAAIEELQAQLPKRGEWVKNEDRCGWHCSCCNVDNYYAYSWNSETGQNEFQDNYCPSCGADMRKKMEVQDG